MSYYRQILRFLNDLCGLNGLINISGLFLRISISSFGNKAPNYRNFQKSKKLTQTVDKKMIEKMKYCNNCEEFVEPQKKINWNLSVFFYVRVWMRNLSYPLCI